MDSSYTVPYVVQKSGLRNTFENFIVRALEHLRSQLSYILNKQALFDLEELARKLLRLMLSNINPEVKYGFN